MNRFVKLSDRLRPDIECAPWVIDEVKRLEVDAERYRLLRTFKTWVHFDKFLKRFIVTLRMEELDEELDYWLKKKKEN